MATCAVRGTFPSTTPSSDVSGLITIREIANPTASWPFRHIATVVIANSAASRRSVRGDCLDPFVTGDFQSLEDIGGEEGGNRRVAAVMVA